MKKILFLLLIPLFFSCCELPENVEQESYAGKVLKGNHPLKKQINGNYYYVKGEKIILHIQFDNQSLFHAFNINQVRFEETDENNAYVKFKWKASRVEQQIIEYYLNHNVIYAVVCIPKVTKRSKEKDEDDEENNSDYVQSLINGTNKPPKIEN